MRTFLVGLCTTLLVFGLWYSTRSSPISLTHDQDILSSPNLISYINLLREQRNLPALVEDPVLMQEAHEAAEDLQGELFSAPDSDYYSVRAFVDGWSRKNEIYAGTKIGVWVTYYVGESGDRPTAYVVTLIR